MLKKPTPVLIIPGLSGSGPQHWQSLWEGKHLEYRRVVQRDWDRADCSEWIETLDHYVAQAIAPPVLVAHSLGCATVVQWAAKYQRQAQAALLVAPSDVESLDFPKAAVNFSPMPLAKLNFTSVVVASTNDPFVDIERAQGFARAWGSQFINIGEAGHINSASGLGQWEEGERLLQDLVTDRWSQGAITSGRNWALSILGSLS